VIAPVARICANGSQLQMRQPCSCSRTTPFFPLPSTRPEIRTPSDVRKLTVCLRSGAGTQLLIGSPFGVRVVSSGWAGLSEAGAADAGAAPLKIASTEAATSSRRKEVNLMAHLLRASY
jgi:hypothetical protein